MDANGRVFRRGELYRAPRKTLMERKVMIMVGPEVMPYLRRLVGSRVRVRKCDGKCFEGVLGSVTERGLRLDESRRVRPARGTHLAGRCVPGGDLAGACRPCRRRWPLWEISEVVCPELEAALPRVIDDSDGPAEPAGEVEL